MNDEQDTTAGSPTPEKTGTGTPAKTTTTSTAKTVTSTRDVDFPSLGWAIRAGEVAELPADAEAQAAILSNDYITLTK